MAPRSERVLVTGGGSFTGLPLAAALRRDGHEVVTVGRDGDDVRADLLDPASIEAAVNAVAPTAVVHLAAITFVPDQDLHRLYATNVAGTAALLRALAKRKADLSAVLLASSAKVYAAPTDGAPIDETAPVRPQDHYGASKAAMEEVARLFSADLPVTVLRPFNYTGPGQDPQFFIPKLVQAFASGHDVKVGNLDLLRDFSDIDVVVEVYRRLIASPRPGATFNICSGVATRLSDVVTWLREITGNDINVSVDPAFVRDDEPRTVVGSSTRLEAAIGPLPRPPFRETLARMAQAAA